MYIGTYVDYSQQKLLVSERIKGQRFTTEYPLVLEYYVPDPEGYYKGIDGVTLKKIELQRLGDIKKHKDLCLQHNTKTYELYQNITHKVLYNNYKGCDVPVLHKSFIDIEVDLDSQPGITIGQLIERANCPINAISVYNDWQDVLYTLMLCPPTLSENEAKQICSEFDNTFLCPNETILLQSLIEILRDSDTISGWNSEGFDIPYIVRRIENVLGEGESKNLCLWDKEPQCKEIENFGSKSYVYSLVGKWSADYLLLYKKHTMSEHESYKLDNIAFEELGERKVAYEGSLDNLYRENYRLFIEYNRQDTMLVYKLDKKLNYINIHNRQAHQIPVTIEATMGTVAWFDQAVINNAHDSGLIVPDRDQFKGTEWNNIVPPGAFVQDPVVGVHEWISDTDLNSLYPSTIRCLNMSPETIVGQVKLTKTLPYLWKKIEENGLWKQKEKRIPDWGAAWGGDELFGTLEFQAIHKQTDELLELQIENGPTVQKTAKEIYDLIFSENSNLCISAFGTIFRTDKQGLVAKILSEWYADRKRMQKEKKRYNAMLEGITISDEVLALLSGFAPSDVTKEYDVKDLKELATTDNVEKLKTFMYNHGLLINDNKIEPVNKEYYIEKRDYWDLEQYLRKINLNSSYGALLQSGSTFYDFRLGASTTYSGRKIVQHMASKLNELAVGEYKHTGGIVVYGDTDSTYFSVATPEFKQKHTDFEYTKENVIKYVDWIAEEVDKSYAEHVRKIFHVTEVNSQIIKAGREIIATRGIYVSKKRYALMVYDDEGTRKDVHGKPGKMKIKGLQTQRADTPMVVRNLLKSMLESLLVDGDREKLIELIRKFKENDWNTLKPWEKGTPKACNKLEYYTEEYRKTNKCSVGHVLGAINWNRLIDVYDDKVSPKVLDGGKVLVCKVNPKNQFGIKSISIPRDINTVPEWFKQLPFDEQSMKDSVVNKTMDSIFGILNWGLSLEAIQEENEELNDILTFC